MKQLVTIAIFLAFFSVSQAQGNLQITLDGSATLPHIDLTETSINGSPYLSFQNSLFSSRRWTLSGGGVATTANSTFQISYFDGATQNNFLTIKGDGEVHRKHSGNADMMAYAYGRVMENSTTVVSGTGNFTVERSNNFFLTLVFSEAIANDLVVTVTPIIYNPFEFPTITSQTGVEYETTTRLRIYFYDQNGNPVANVAPFSFVAYKP